MRLTRLGTIVILVLFLCLCSAFVSARSRQNIATDLANNPDILNSQGIQLASSGDLVGAIRLWRRALNLAPANVHLYNNIGSALKRLGHDDYAFKWYSAALEVKETHWIYYNLALLYQGRKQYREACWALDKALKLKADFVLAVDLLAKIRSGKHDRPADNDMAGIKQPIKLPASEKTTNYQKSVRKLPKKNKFQHYSEIVSERSSEAIRLHGDKGGQVFLTFDGGAEDDGFDSIMSSLRKYGVKCTFFLTGKFVLNYPERARTLLAEGHEIANHSMNHPDMKKWNKEKIACEIELAEKAFEKVLGRRGANFFRFPFGHQNKRVEKIVEELGYYPVYWHIDTIDWREDPIKTIIARVDKKLQRGAVILMHIGSKNGASALDRILKIIFDRGYELARLSDLDPSLLASLP